MLETPFLDDHHRSLAEQVANFVQQHVKGIAPRMTEEEQCRLLVRSLAREGLLVHTVPLSFETSDRPLDVRALCVVRDGLSYESSLGDLMFAMQGLGSFPLALAGSDEIRNSFLPQVRSGEAIAAFAITEPQAGSDVSAIQTSARRDGSSYVIDGAKTFISNAGLADFYTVFAKTDATTGSKGISAFVVEKDTAGFYFDGRIELIAPHPIGRLRFDGCRVPITHRLGEEGAGFKLAMTTLDTFRPTVGAAALGLASRALDEAISYAGKRVQFGRPIAEFQATQMKLAEMATDLDAARLLVYRAAWKKDTVAGRVTLESAMAKLFATEAAQRIIDASVQIHGGTGVVVGSVVERLYREVRALRIYEGTSEIQKLVIAGQLLR
ncbi:MAG TPA: acyl-CoA dehydrogenase family protein [Blastocatellia bacterium]|nr:acyl-CoA dehydrogenase family protein [Blastocatellia bacterium]